MSPCNLTWSTPGLPKHVPEKPEHPWLFHLHVLCHFAMQIENWGLIPDTNPTATWELYLTLLKAYYYFSQSNNFIKYSPVDKSSVGLELTLYHQCYSMTSGYIFILAPPFPRSQSFSMYCIESISLLWFHILCICGSKMGEKLPDSEFSSNITASQDNVLPTTDTSHM